MKGGREEKFEEERKEGGRVRGLRRMMEVSGREESEDREEEGSRGSVGKEDGGWKFGKIKEGWREDERCLRKGMSGDFSERRKGDKGEK